MVSDSLAPEQVQVFGDPTTRAIDFLDRVFPGAVSAEEPDGKLYHRDQLLILVRDAGGQGVRHAAFVNHRVTFEVRHESRALAAEYASRVDALIRQWPYIERDVYALDLGDTPTFSPEADRRIPAYVWTYGFNFRGRWQTVGEISQ